ncbi:MAG: hypothetical protein EBV34_16105 [Betaproteobacteria bacterium]|nr:hypothetical protein [Betaproteobacteria bacterium]
MASLSKRCDAACFAVTQLDGQGLIAKTIEALGKADGSVSAEVVLTKQCEAQGLASVQSFAAGDLSKPLAIITAMGLAQTLGDAFVLNQTDRWGSCRWRGASHGAGAINQTH